MKKLKIAFILVLLCTGTCLLVSCHRGTNRQELEGADVQNLEDAEAQANDDPSGIPQGELVEIRIVLDARPTGPDGDWQMYVWYPYNPFGGIGPEGETPNITWLGNNLSAKLFGRDGKLVSHGTVSGGFTNARGPDNDDYYNSVGIIFEMLIPEGDLEEAYSVWVGSKSGDKTWISETYDVRRLAPYPK